MKSCFPPFAQHLVRFSITIKLCVIVIICFMKSKKNQWFHFLRQRWKIQAHKRGAGNQRLYEWLWHLLTYCLKISRQRTFSDCVFKYNLVRRVFVPLDQRSRNERPWKVRFQVQSGLPVELRMPADNRLERLVLSFRSCPLFFFNQSKLSL